MKTLFRLIDDNNDFYECIAINNFASIRAAEKIGFKKDGFVKKSKYLHTLSRVKESSTLLYKYNRNTNSSDMKKLMNHKRMGPKMKILIICNSASGLEVFRGMLIKRLIKEGNTVSSIIPVAAEQKELNAEKRNRKMELQINTDPMERRGMNPIKDINFIKIIL